MIDKIIRFGESMQRELDSNSHKGNWEDWKNIEEMIYELDNDKEKCKEYIADCANIFFFYWKYR